MGTDGKMRYMRRIRPRICNIPGYKGYNYTTIIYLEDMEQMSMTYGDLLAHLDSLHIRCAVSPIHDMDRFTADDVWTWCESHLDEETGDLDQRYIDDAPYVGKKKKAHVHTLFMNRSKKSVAEMHEILGMDCVRLTMWERAEDPYSLVRYFAHLDSPDKYPYSAFDIHGFGGINLDALVINDTKSHMYEISSCLVDLIQQEKIYYFHQFINKIRIKYPDPDFESCAFGRHALFNAIIKSRRQEHMDEVAKRERERKRRMTGDLLG